METKKVVKVVKGEYSQSYGIVHDEGNETLNCTLSGPNYSKGTVQIPKEYIEPIEDVRAGVAYFTIDNLVWWIQKKVKEAKANGVVVGVSGGIDSAVVSALCKKAFPDKSIGLIMPCNSIPDDRKYAEMVCDAIDLDHKVMDLSETFNVMIKSAKENGLAGDDAHPLVGGNLKARLRMSTLYMAASARGYLVVGTDNAPESVTGYFTKYGDGGVDILPISSLLKRQVREVARYLNIPESIIAKPPSAGLYEGQTDESEMGLRYDDIDDYIVGFEIQSETKQRIQEMEAKTQHKREMPPSAPKEMNALFNK